MIVMTIMMGAFTSLPVKPETLRRIKAYKVMGKTYDDLLNEWMDEVPPADFLREHARRLEEESISWDELKAKEDRGRASPKRAHPAKR